MLQALDVQIPEEVQIALDHRWAEDTAFSADNRRVALAGYSSQNVVVLDIDIQVEPAVSIAVRGVTVVRCEQFALPHGLCFLDGDLLAVANREGAVLLFDLPPATVGHREVTLAPVLVVGAEDSDMPVESPGSVTSVRVAPGLFELLVCNNYVNKVTRHVVDVADGQARVVSERVLVAEGLGVPDGVAISPDRRLLLVSNHDLGASLVYDNDATLAPTSAAVGALRGIGHPHGAQFTPDGRFVLVADAGKPLVHVFRDDTAQWRGDHLPVHSVRVVTEDDYQRNELPGEGGPKGLTLDATGRLVLVVGQYVPVAFFDTTWFTGETFGPAPAVDRDRAERQLLLREAEHAAALRSRISELEDEAATLESRIAILEKLVDRLYDRVLPG